MYINDVHKRVHKWYACHNNGFRIDFFFCHDCLTCDELSSISLQTDELNNYSFNTNIKLKDNTHSAIFTYIINQLFGKLDENLMMSLLFCLFVAVFLFSTIAANQFYLLLLIWLVRNISNRNPIKNPQSSLSFQNHLHKIGS